MQKEHPRIVSLVPSWTETLFAMGLDAGIVGVTRWCVHPKELVAHIEKVGGTKDPDVLRIVALRPDLVVCDHEEQRKEDVEALRAAGLDVFLSDVRGLEDSLRDVRRLGEATGRTEAAHAIAQRVRATMTELASQREAPIPVYVPIWRRPWMTMTKDTYAHAVLDAAGARNVFADAEGRYPERGPEEALEAGARAVLLPTEPYPFHTKEEAVLEELVEAGFPKERVHLVDGEALTWYGAREAEGLRAVAATVQRLR
ncbi:MAG TPA: helical backbone metal receptor [Candidatus Thermoplasmatota archaeon]|nr:helical backbone metal receptor [Candidatus Thermoplasmatota archaeon]